MAVLHVEYFCSTENKDVRMERLGEFRTVRRPLQNGDMALRKVHEELTIAFGELVSSGCMAKILEEKLSVARVNIEVQSSLREESLKQVDVKLTKLKEVQS